MILLAAYGLDKRHDNSLIFVDAIVLFVCYFRPVSLNFLKIWAIKFFHLINYQEENSFIQLITIGGDG